MLRAEFRHRTQSVQFMLYTAVATYLIYSVAPQPSPSVWLAFLWLVVLFSAMQAAFRAFHEPESLWSYFNQLARPSELLWVKSGQVALHTATF